MKNKFLKFFVAISFLTIASCETTELELLDDVNNPDPSLLDPNFVFNNIQLALPGYVNAVNDFTRDVTRQTAMTGGTTYNSAFQEVSFNGIWGSGYSILNNIKAMEPKATELNLTYHLGASKVIKAYVWSSLADIFGDIPYSEALQGNVNLAPKYDNSADVYKGAIEELNQAIILLAQDPSALPKQDLYYGAPTRITTPNSTQSKWLTLAKTLKLKLLNNARLNGAAIGINIPNEMSLLLAENDLIDTPSEDFSFKYGSNRVVPNSRHPDYNNTYENATRIGGTYLGNYFMWTVVVEKGIADPRRPFYFFRQDTNTVGETIFTLGCAFQSRPSHYNSATFASFYQPAVLAPFCVTTTSGYWGRDHGDGSGLPPDNAKRTVFGVYPAGGKYDEGVQASVQNNGTDGFNGEGIMPILMSSWTEFIKAEAVLTQGVSGDARVFLESGIRKSINTVANFKPNLPLPSVASIDNYVNFVLNAYDNSTSARKLEIVIKEYYIAAWGNGLETYNNYRRTGYPSNMQPTLNPAITDFYYTGLYPSDSTANNPNAPTNNSRTKRVFWDPGNLVLN